MKNSTFSAQVANNLLTLLQGYSKTIRLLLVMLLTLTVTTNAWAEDYSIKFLTAASDGSTEITSSTRTSTVLENASCDYVTGFTSNCTKAYYKGKSGVKLSSSKASGTLEFNLADICKQNVSKIVFKTVQYSDESSTLTFYAGSTSLGTTTSGTTFTHTFNSSQEVSSIKITSSKRSYISEIIISTSGNAGGSTPTQLAAPTGLKANNITSSGATLSWNAVANASSYTLQVYGENDDVIAEYTGLTQTTKEVSGLEPETYYVWGVTAIGNGTTYEDSNEKTGEFTTSAAGGDGGECSWKETAIGDIQSTDIVVITMTNNSGSTYAMSNDKGTGSAPAATKVTVSGTKLTGTIADNLKWNISNSNGTLTIYPNETTSTWLYCTASNNGVRVGTNTNKTFTIDATSGYLKHVGTSRYLGVYNNADWRCYTNTTGNTANQTLKFYVYQCSDDGGDDPEPVIVKTLKSIAVTGMTTTFEQGDVFKFDGTCTATYSVTKDGAAQADETAEVTPTNVSTPDMNQIGTQTVYVTYSEGGVEKTDDYKITITENTVTAGEYCITPNNEFWGTNFNGSLSGEALNQTYTGRQDDITIQYAKGSSQYMYINDSQTRVYGNNSLTFSVPSSYVITAIAFTADGNNWNGTHTSNVGSMTDSKNWEGSAKEVTITFGGNCRITKICVTYEELDLTLPSAPTFTPAAGTYNAVQNVTISAEAGTTIYYTLDGTDPTTASNVYASAIEISETTTVKAIAVKDEKVSPIASATYTINLPLTTMDQIFAKATAVGTTATSVEITFGNWVVSAVKEDGKTAFVTDGTKGFVIYEVGCGFKVGDVLSGTAACKVLLYNGFAELTGLTSSTTGLTVSTGGTITTQELDAAGIAALTGVNTGSLIKINGICSSSDSKYYVADVQIYTSLYNFGTLEVGAEYNITGIYQPYNSTKEILPRSAADIEKVVGLPTATIAIADITMEVGEEKDIEATITPDAAQTKVQYAITAGSEYIDLDGTTITAVAAGTATITATIAEAAGEYYGTTKTFNVTVKPQNIAVLSFTFDGGKADIENTLGMSQTGLDDDYNSAPKLKFNGAGDNVIIHFDRQAGEFSFLLKQNGQNAGTFTVYESANGEDYTPIWSGGDFGNAQSETIKPTLSATARYVKFEYTTKGTSTNYALGSISIAKPDTRQEANLSWNPTSVTLTQGEAFTAPTLQNPKSVSGITYESSNDEVATVTAEGVIALASAIGTATITATFAGDATYKPATATCTIIVNAIPALAAPTGLTVTDLTCSSVTLSWNAVTNATGYEVVRTLNAHNTTYTTDEPSITIKDLTGGLENAWKVRAMGDGVNHGNSDYTTGDNFTTLFSVKYYVDEALWYGCDNGCAANGKSFEICETTPTKANYDFAGWATSVGGEVAYQAGETINNIAANVTLHAVWTLKKYTVTWIADDTETTMQFEHGADLTLPDAPTPCDGMEFVGWTTQRAYIHNTDPLFTEATGTVTSDATYYAVFATQGTSTGATTLDFSKQGYENAKKVTSLGINGITVSFAKGEATTDATYYNTGTAVRVYAKGKFTVSAAESSISQIVLTFGEGDKSNAITSNIGTYTNGTWTGEANSVTFTVGGDTDHRRIKSITVTSGGGASTFTGHTTTCSGTTTLDAPQNLAVSNIKYNSATFTWDEVEGARSYSITIGDMTPITTTTNTYTTNPLKAGTAYTWSVQALGNNTNVLHSSVTIGPEFSTGASVTITWVTGGESTTTTTTAGLPLGTLKNTTPPAGCSTKTFIGWTTTRSIDSTGEGITYITEETVPTKNTTYYAVFAEPEDNGGALGSQLFYESFNSVDGTTGGTDGQWSGSIASVQLTEFGDWTLSFAYKGNKCIKLGTGESKGSATTPALEIDGTATLSFSAGAWNANNEETGINLIIVGEGTIKPSYIKLNKGQFDQYTATITGANAETKVQFIAEYESNNRFFLDEVYVHEGSTTTYTDYSTSCGTYFVTFYGFTGYSTTCNGNPAEVEVAQGGRYTIPDCTPTTDPQGLGRTFAGTWNTKANGKGTSYSPGQEIYPIDDHITLYAQWALNTESNITLPTDVEDLANTDIVVNGGNTLTLQTGTTTINSLTLKGGLQENGSYAMPVVNIPTGAALVRNNNKINLDLKVNNNSYYPFAVPFEVANTAANVNYINPTLKEYANANQGYGKFYRILEYNGALRAENGVNSAENWVHVGRTDVKLMPGKGYAISAVPAAGDDTVTIRITMTVDNAWLANGEQESITVKEQTTTRNAVEVTAYTGEAAEEHQRHAGWNFVANPYLANFAGTNASGSFINGEILIDKGEYSYSDDKVPYVTIPTYDFAHYNQVRLSEATLSPAYSFFVQVDKSGTMTFATDGRQQAPASIAARNAEERPVKMDVDITLSDNHSSDQTGIIISDRYSDAYEIGRDLEKLFGSAYNLSVYTLMADNTPLAFQALAIRSNMQVIPVGYRAPEQGEYTFRLNEATSSIDLLNEQYEQLVLVDYQTGELTNLLIADYTFYSERTQADNRFAIYAVPRQNAPTDLPNAIGQDKQAQKIIHNGHLYILRDGNVYNGNGQIVK